MSYLQIFPVGRLLRVLLGTALALELWVGNPFLTTDAPAILGIIGSVAGFIVLYVLVAMFIGRKIIARLNPWFGAALLDSPVVLVSIPQVPAVLRLAILEYFAVSLVCQGVCGFGGCEVLALPNTFLGTRLNVACVMFSPFDWLEGELRRKFASRN